MHTINTVRKPTTTLIQRPLTVLDAFLPAADVRLPLQYVYCTLLLTYQTDQNQLLFWKNTYTRLLVITV